MGVYAGRSYPIDLGDDPSKMYWILRRQSVMYDVPERPVEISGPEVVPFLEKVFARHIATLKEGRGRYAIACTPQGGVFMDGVLFRLSDNRFWYVQPDGALVPWLIAHSGGFDVTISDPKSRVLQIQGPTSPAVIAAATEGAITDAFKYFHAGFFDIGGQRLFVSRTGWTGELGYEIYTQGEATDCPRLWDHLIEAGKPHGMEFSTISSMEIRRIEAGILDNLTDFDWTMTPFGAGLGPFIDVDKLDFIGREALLAADRRTVLFGLKCPNAIPRMDDIAAENGVRLGRITAGVWSPYLDCGIGYVRFDSAKDWVGQSLTLCAPDGGKHECEVVSLPFYDSEKRIPRGLDHPQV
nr:aminomethyltransferase family protein [Pseudohalocynthiibacter aestuariivivens]